MSFPFQIVIPCRYGASRLPGKPLLDIGGKPLIQHAFDSSIKSKAKQVIIATDDERIESVARSFGADVVMTAAQHKTGTDRIAEVIELMGISDDMIIVNVQGDVYGLPSALIDQVAEALHNNVDTNMSTLCEKITDVEDYDDPNVVKVISDKDGKAIYFSRAGIPWRQHLIKDHINNYPAYRHVGIYAYRAGFLKIFAKLAPSLIEMAESLEQLRAIFHGYSIQVDRACAESGMSIDTEDDLQIARKRPSEIDIQ
jgi:3-deoxy-manno-octulosonate cytidylyltransferase (CMP-KDO synthetase)